jgi:uncharacterized protein DUF6689
MRRILACLTLVLSAALPAGGQGIVNTTVSGTSASVAVSLPGGLGADVTLSFEEVEGLSLANLGLSVQVINPLNPALLARLPASVTPALPVMLRIEPPPSGGLTFTGVATLEIHTHNLQYTPGCPLRLFVAPLGGAFRDATSFMGAGSYRARATKGGFSEFLIVADARATNAVIEGKFDRLEAMLDDYEGSMPAALHDDLSARLAAARADHEQGATRDAIREIDGFLAEVQAHSGTDIPDVWRSARDVDNVAGYLRGGAMTLRFSLGLKLGPGL